MLFNGKYAQMKLRIFSLIPLAAALLGCATAYQPQGLSGGFTETQLAPDVWRVSFSGNGYTKGERAEDFAMLRSAELTLGKLCKTTPLVWQV